ncbi:phosphatidylserine decarboxylase [Thioalkalivibrio paradoxus]|uniref:Phosphatidylserine decarboxylase n=1 Tax=Thioalkalivibrio paradoxus ARh 1 TaxID=713585 RepID=W0DKH4_9GAMM|nr:phosphatidylserine decarboxylase [Thioalkalivibrio paradoxus]AHE97508.1 phosphatidylserine decarboxylase [Thioalkalivibrio paradoxus ARh 1]
MFPIAPEGRLFVVGTAWLAVITLLFGYTEPGAFLVTLAVALLLVFRDFVRRDPPANALGLLAPVDGVVQSLDQGTDPFTGKPAQRIVIRQRALGEYHLHAPQEAKLLRRAWPGRDTGDPVDPQLNGQLGFAFETDEGQGFSLAFDLRRWPRFVRVGAVTGSRIGRGKRLGFAGFGSTVTLWVPAKSALTARPGQRVFAGMDRIGDLPGHAARPTGEPGG